jgi:hypothetical protein
VPHALVGGRGIVVVTGESTRAVRVDQLSDGGSRSVASLPNAARSVLAASSGRSGVAKTSASGLPT